MVNFVINATSITVLGAFTKQTSFPLNFKFNRVDNQWWIEVAFIRHQSSGYLKIMSVRFD
jgi:hypothetical protein